MSLAGRWMRRAASPFDDRRSKRTCDLAQALSRDHFDADGQVPRHKKGDRGAGPPVGGDDAFERISRIWAAS